MSATPLIPGRLYRVRGAGLDLKVIASHPASLKDQAALLSLLNDQDIHEPDQLKALLDTSDKFRALASDAGDFFTRLNDLVTTNQE